jgi:hypothetical protein
MASAFGVRPQREKKPCQGEMSLRSRAVVAENKGERSTKGAKADGSRVVYVVRQPLRG